MNTPVQTEYRMPRLNEPAPEFEAVTTHGKKKLSDYKSAVRSTFVIDDKGVLRAMVYYPMTNGRSIPEFVRLVQALQTSDKNKVATPEGWKPGDKVIVPAPKTTLDVDARMKEGYECADWYFCKKSLAA